MLIDIKTVIAICMCIILGYAIYFVIAPRTVGDIFICEILSKHERNFLESHRCKVLKFGGF